MEVFNLRTGKRIHTITGFEEPHDIVYLPDSDKLIVTDGGDDFGWVKLVSAKNYQIVDKIKLANGVDEAVVPHGARRIGIPRYAAVDHWFSA